MIDFLCIEIKLGHSLALSSIQPPNMLKLLLTLTKAQHIDDQDTNYSSNHVRFYTYQSLKLNHPDTSDRMLFVYLKRFLLL